jgi:hypothetical protein
MTIQNKLKLFLPVIILFLLLNVLFFAGTILFEKWNVDRNVLIFGNLILFVVSFISFLISMRGLDTVNPHAFVRSVYGSIMLKLFVCIIAAFIYIMSFKKEVNKPALLICMAFYLIYTFTEVSVLTKYLKKRSNAKERSAD